MQTSTVLVLLAAFLSLLAVSAIVVIVVKAPSTTDQLTLIGAIIAFLTPLITSVLALVRAEHANGKADGVTALVDTHLANGGTSKV